MCTRPFFFLPRASPYTGKGRGKDLLTRLLNKAQGLGSRAMPWVTSRHGSQAMPWVTRRHRVAKAQGLGSQAMPWVTSSARVVKVQGLGSRAMPWVTSSARVVKVQGLGSRAMPWVASSARVVKVQGPINHESPPPPPRHLLTWPGVLSVTLTVPFLLDMEV